MAERATVELRSSPRRAPSVFLACIGLVWAVALLCYAFVWIADPYELRFPRPGERLADHPYPDDIVPRLASVAANGGADMVIIGSSTALGYTPNMMRQAFPDLRRPANLAFECGSPQDLQMILPRLEQSATLKRVLISLDESVTGTTCRPSAGRYYVQNWLDPAPEFNLQSLQLSVRVLLTGDLDLDAWRPLPNDRVDWITTDPPVTANPGAMAYLRRAVALEHGRAAAGPPLPCAAVPNLRTIVAPFIRRMASRGVQVDLLAPPLSLAFYSEWAAGGTHFATPGFATMMAVQRCALQMTAGLSNVRFYSFDTDPAIVGNLTLYSDSTHLRDVDTFRQILRRIASRQAQVTLQAWPRHEAALKREVDAYTL